MIRGRGKAVFFAEKIDGSFSETLTILVNDRVPLTHKNAVGKTEQNKATHEVLRTIKGYRFEEELTVLLPAHYQNLQAWIDRNNDTTKESDFHKIIRILDYSNRPEYKILFWPREELQTMIAGIECRVKEKEIAQAEGIRSDTITVTVRGIRTIDFPVMAFKNLYKLLYDFNEVMTSKLIFEYENTATAKDIFDYSDVLTGKLLSSWTRFERIERMGGIVGDNTRIFGFSGLSDDRSRVFGFSGIDADDLQRIFGFSVVDSDYSRIFGFAGIEEQLARIHGFADIKTDRARVFGFDGIQSEA